MWCAGAHPTLTFRFVGRALPADFSNKWCVERTISFGVKRRKGKDHRQFPCFSPFSPFSLFPFSPCFKTYRFFATRILASMPLWMNSGAAKPAACIHSATSAWV